MAIPSLDFVLFVHNKPDLQFDLSRRHVNPPPACDSQARSNLT